MKIVRAGDIEASITYKNIRHMYIRVLPPDGQVVVSAPVGVSDRTIEQFISKASSWINEQRIKLAAESEIRQDDRRKKNERVYLFGKEYSVEQLVSDRDEIYTEDSRLIIRCAEKLTPDEIGSAIKEWKRTEFKRILPRLTLECERITLQKAYEWRIKDMKTKWGSCNVGARRIWLRLELASYPIECIRMVIIHELTHLTNRHHNKNFYDLMQSFCPEYKKFQKVLESKRYE